MKIEHIGIAVTDLDQAEKTYEEILGVKVYKREEVASESVITSFLATANSKIELLASTDPSGPVARFIQKRGPGIHHIALEVEDIDREMERLSGLGYRLLSDKPGAGADHKRIVFLHPSSAHGVLIELCQEIEE